MSQALTPPFLVAALVLCVAGVAKLRVSRRAMGALGVGEVALGAACLVHPARSLALALAVLYASFTVVAEVLRRRRLACGCFGENDFPVSLAHVIASGLLGSLALAAAIAGPRGLGWLAGGSAVEAVVLLIATAGAAYAAVLVYTAVPRAWAGWSGE
ncbi:MAG TPA: MauE/DoxX family redox-associated membrane protein [Solirubrobacteraceae bacterium]|nr:MauE/DoxX family redox-associated membrane protein [Solirubrobacteraceae bacterium]